MWKSISDLFTGAVPLLVCINLIYGNIFTCKGEFTYGGFHGPT
jgi:hypothetical protein